MTTATLYPPSVVAGLRPPATQCPSEWAEANIELPRGETPRPGPVRHRNAPYLAGLMDLCTRRGVTRVNVQKAGQIGVSAALRWLMAYWAATDPEPVGLALPDKLKGQKIVSNRIVPMFEGNTVLRDLSTGRAHDTTRQQIRLANGFILHLMWSGSPSSAASDPMCRAICDEVDKFAEWPGREAHPVQLVEVRLRTYESRALQVNVSTPTTRLGQISQLFDQSQLKLYFLVECPGCLKWQRFVFSGLKWPKYAGQGRPDRGVWARQVIDNDAAWYECQACHETISERLRRQIVQRGRWGTVGADGVLADGLIDDALQLERFAPHTTIGLQISAMYCTWTRLSTIAAESIESAGNLSKMVNFRNSTLGEVFEHQTAKLRPATIRSRAADAELPEAILPKWTAYLLASIDTQADHFWVVIRAWGPNMRSARIWHGRVDTFTDLDAWIQQPFEFDAGELAPWTVASNGLAVIDSGGTRQMSEEGEHRPSRTMDVYKWVLSRPAWTRAIKGDSNPRPGEHIRRAKGVYVTEHKETILPLWLLDVQHYHDELAQLITTKTEQGEAIWKLNQRDDPEYARHLSNMTKVVRRAGELLTEEWVPVGAGARVDYRACECYGLAAAYMVGVHLLPDLPHYLESRAANIAAQQQEQRTRGGGGMKTPDGRPFLITQR